MVTIENITELIKVQRAAAWSDIAKKIAHEIKNPLTPIQLSADRLKHKYLNKISEDKKYIHKLHRYNYQTSFYYT